MAGGGPSDLGFQRVHNDIVNRRKVRTVYDFAYGQFLAWRNFFDEVSRVQNSLINNGGVVELKTGQTADVQTVGGSLAISIFLETIETTKESMVGLSKLGLKNENKLWTLQ